MPEPRSVTSPAAPAPEVVIPTPPVALSAAEYQDKLRSANDAVAPMLGRLTHSGIT
ncbi:MAG: hypothetical protein ACRDRA_14215 [Pseudonocardiaceae bacterium]